MRRRLAGLAALVAAVGTTVGLVSPAGAASAGKSYERGDAPAAIDITRLHVTNGDQRFVMQVKVRDLQEKGRFAFHHWPGRHGVPPARNLLLVVRHDEEGLHAHFLACGREDCSPASCRSFRATWRSGADAVRVTARQRCVPGARTPGTGRFFAWSRTATHIDERSSSLLVERGQDRLRKFLEIPGLRRGWAGKNS